MTLRQCADSFVENVVSHLNSRLKDSSKESIIYNAESWNVLHSQSAINYIFNCLKLSTLMKEYKCVYTPNIKSMIFNRIEKIKTPISSLGLDEEFNWDTVTMN